jgi:8-oxo-dGTP pyrophosphatase MutT (NUDIX family)
MDLRRRGPWHEIASREVYRNPWIRLREDQVIRPDGRPGIYGVVEMAPAVGVVALTDDQQVYLVGQYRYPTECDSWEIITGFASDGEAPVDAARRELREETGLTAEHWTPLGWSHISNSVTDQVGYLFLAQGLVVGSAAPDGTESLLVRPVPITEALRLAQSSGITQGFSLVGIYRAWHRLTGDLD